MLFVAVRLALRKALLRFITNDLLVLVAIAALLFFITDYFYVVLPLPLFTSYPTGDEPHYLIISQTILKYHSLDVTRDYIHGDYRQFYPFTIDPHVVRNVRGQVLPVHNIGGPILWLIPFALLGRLGAVFLISLVSILCVINIYKLLLLLGSSKRIAFVAGLAYIVASPLYIYSHLTFVELIGAFICICVLRKTLQAEIKTVDLWLCASLLGLLPWVHIRFAQLEISLFCILLYRLYRQNKLRSIKQDVALLLPIGVLFVLLEVYSLVIWGTWNPAANETMSNATPFEISPVSNIFLGFFFDQEYGLLFSAPVFLFLLMGLVFSMRKQLLGYNLSMLIICVPYIILFATYRDWFGGYNPSARYLLVLHPLLCVYLARGIERLWCPLAKIWFIFSIIYGFVYNLASMYQGFSAGYGYNVTIKFMESFIHLPVTDYLPSLFACNQTSTLNCDQHEFILFFSWITFFAVISLAIVIQSRKNATKTLHQ